MSQWDPFKTSKPLLPAIQGVTEPRNFRDNVWTCLLPHLPGYPSNISALSHSLRQLFGCEVWRSPTGVAAGLPPSRGEYAGKSLVPTVYNLQRTWRKHMESQASPSSGSEAFTQLAQSLCGAGETVHFPYAAQLHRSPPLPLVPWQEAAARKIQTWIFKKFPSPPPHAIQIPCEREVFLKIIEGLAMQ